MGVTNGFLKLSHDELDRLRTDRVAFEQRTSEYDENNGYLEMDKAGYELAYILDDSIADHPNPEKQRFQNIAAVLAGGTPVHADLDLGYGPAVLIDETAVKDSLEEFKQLGFDTFFQFASEEFVADMVMCEMDETSVREYHWAYLQSLNKFLSDAASEGFAVLRY